MFRTQNDQDGIMDTAFTEKEKILVVEGGPGFTEEIMDYAIQLGARTGCGIMAVNIYNSAEGNSVSGTLTGNGIAIPESFAKTSFRCAADFGKKAEKAGVLFRHRVRSGNVGDEVWTLTHSLKRVDLIIADQDSDYEEITGRVSVPVFRIESDSNGLKKKNGGLMAGASSGNRKEYVVKTAIYGAISAALYAAVFMNSEIVMKYFTKGGLYSALPIATVFIFSFAHGGFTGNLWSMLGIEAVTPQIQKKTEEVVRVSKVREVAGTTARKRPQASI